MAENIQNGSERPLDFGNQQIPPEMGKYLKWGGVIVGLIVLFSALSFFRSIYTDLLWFDSLGFRGVFTKILLTRAVLFAIGAVAFSSVMGLSLIIAGRSSAGPITLPLPPEAIVFLRRLVLGVSIAAALLLGLIFGGVMASRWELFLRYSNAVSFDQLEPVFNRDISFYVFTLPVLHFLQSWLLGASILILLGTFALYFVRFNLKGESLTFTRELKIHVSVIGAFIMFVIAWGHWLDRYGLLLSDQGAIFGAAYTDIHARMPALLVLTIITAGSGILMLVNTYFQAVRLLVGAAVLWIAMSILLSTVWPAINQQLTVNPNEFVLEEPYIARNLEFTRAAFGLENIEEAFYSAESAVDAQAIEENLQTINNIRLWDYRPLSDVYRQIQVIRPYYDFKDADVDRYVIDGKLRQVLLSAREVAPEKLQLETQTWTNTKLVYTHGIGLAMSPVTEFTPEGRPVFFAQDIPSDGVIPIGSQREGAEPDLLVTNPRIYYGENTLEYIIVNTSTDELDYQTAVGDLFRTNYFGTGGVQLGSFLRRAAYAWQLADINILISGQIQDDSLIQYRREIQERISTVAPFLMLDSDPYIVAAEGQLFWMQDAYTFNDLYPYSDPTIGDDPTDDVINYIRNSVKVTVDAFNGSLRFHIWDESDPMVLTYAKIFPDLFVSREEMPESLQSHVRYPSDFFRIQAEKYIRYHMKEPQNFYNNEDLWAFAEEKFGQSDVLQVVEPYYVIMKLPGEENEEFVQLLPYTPNERQNLIGWLAARSDGENYGKLVAFNFPKDRQVDGPAQVEARIDNDQDISAWFTLRCTEGSFCLRGNLLVIPVGNGIIYAEPVYIQAEGISFPELKKVILVTGDKVVMEDSLQLAITALVGDVELGAPRLVEKGVTPEGPPPSEPGEPTGLFEEQVERIREAIQTLKDNLAALEEAVEGLR